MVAVSAFIAFTCKPCGHRAEWTSAGEFMAGERHVCTVADQIRRAVPYWRNRGRDAVADWLEDCARDADRMTGPGDVGVCAGPGSVRHALRVSQETPWEAS